MGEIWRIKAGKGGAGSFLCPPGHPALTHTLEGFHSSGDGVPQVTRASGPDYLGGIGDHAGQLPDYVPGYIKAHADRLHASAVLVCSPDWVANVYGYFRNSYSPDGEDRNVSNSVIYKPGACAKCGGRADAAPHVAGRPTPRWVKSSWHKFTPPERPPAERHLGYLCVRSYFPDHVPDLALIDGRGILYGQRPCVHCGAGCQYDARIDGWAPYAQDGTCAKSPTGRHEIDRP